MSAARSASARLAVLTRHHGPDDPAVAEARRDLRVTHAEVTLAELVASAPPPKPEQIERLAALLGGGHDGP